MSITMDSVFNFSSENLDLSPSSSSSSSIGRNSDDDGDLAGDNEVESPYKSPLDIMESLEEVLPIRRGISKFYNGKSKSFTNLTKEAESSSLTSSSSMKDLAKPENPYSRRRRNLLCHQIWENNNKTTRGGIFKKPIMSSSRSALTLAMAVAAGGGEGGSSSSSSGDESSSPRQRHSNQMLLPPLYPRSRGSFGNLISPRSRFCALKSYSVADFPRCFPATASGVGSNDS